MHSLRNSLERLDFLPVSKARTDKLYIFRQCTYIVYEYIAISGKEMFRNRHLHFIIRCITVERYKESSGITRGLPIAVTV